MQTPKRKAFADRYSRKERWALLSLIVRQNNLGRGLSFLCWRLMASEVLHDKFFANDIRPIIGEALKDINIDEED